MVAAHPDRLRRLADVLEVCLEMEDTESETTVAATPKPASDSSDGAFEFNHIGPYRTIEWLGMGGMGTNSTHWGDCPRRGTDFSPWSDASGTLL